MCFASLGEMTRESVKKVSKFDFACGVNVLKAPGSKCSLKRVRITLAGSMCRFKGHISQRRRNLSRDFLLFRRSLCSRYRPRLLLAKQREAASCSHGDATRRRSVSRGPIRGGQCGAIPVAQPLTFLPISKAQLFPDPCRQVTGGQSRAVMASSPLAEVSPSPSPSSSNPLVPLSVLPASLGSHLLPNEEVLSLCPSVGLYSGSAKLADQQDGVAYLTSHRIIYIDASDPRSKSVYLRLALVKMTEYYAGFLKSSPKVILGIKREDDETDAHSRAELAKAQDELSHISLDRARGQSSSSPFRLASGAQDPASQRPSSTNERWVCPVCSFSNTASQGGAEVCQLCGVKRDPTASSSSTPPSARPASTMIPSHAPTQTSRGSAIQIMNGAKSLVPTTSCPVCTFDNHPSMARCEICDSPLGTESWTIANGHAKNPILDSLRPPNGHKTPTDQSSASLPNAELIIKLSFRKGGDKAFYEALSAAMRRGAWKRRQANADTKSRTANGSTSIQRPTSGLGPGRAPLTAAVRSVDIDGRASTTPRSDSPATSVVGIDGLLTAYSNRSAAQTSDMSDALKDLRGLMAKAKQMVDLAENLNARLVRREAEASAKAGREGSAGAATDPADEEDGTAAAATLIRSSLIRLGLPTRAITQEMAKDEREYQEGLARELGFVLLGGTSSKSGGLMGKGKVLEKGQELQASTKAGRNAINATGMAGESEGGRGIIGLDEVWVTWNRLRGVALIPPASLLSVTSDDYLSRVTDPPIKLRTLPSSGLKVLHTPRFADDVFARRTLARLREQEQEDQLQEAMRRSQLEQEELEVVDPPESLVHFHGHGLTTLAIARSEGVSLLLATDLLASAELLSGVFVRDDQAGEVGPEGISSRVGGTTWYVNRFQELAEQGQVKV